METYLPIPRMSRTTVKMLAIVCMTLNHMAHILMSGREGTFAYEICIAIGYFTCITMCYLMVDGYKYTSDVRKYLARLLIFGVLSQYPYWLAFHVPQLNMMFSLALCLMVLIVRHRVMNKTLQTVFTILILIASAFTDWAIMAPLFTVLFVIAKEREESLWKAYISGALVLGLTELSSGTIPAYALLRVVPLLVSGAVIQYGYDGGKRRAGSKPMRNCCKWFFYLYYPLHLVVLMSIRR